MTAEELTAYWQLHYPVEPRAHELRTACANRWFRIHALPEGKRYPETAEEYATVLLRHNAVLTEVMGDGGKAVLVTMGGSK